jgi:broad specificity phosphatase PhoE
MSRLLIVRHARAKTLDDLRLPGPDVGLLPEGEAEARALACRLQRFGPAAIYASDARRARQTGEIIASARGVTLHLLPALREIDFGAWGGQTFAAIVERDPTAERWFIDPTVAPPDGEDVLAAAERVLAALASLQRHDAENIVVVGHAGSLRLAIARALGMPLAASWRLRIDCASLSIVDWTAEGPIVESWNDTSHLDATPRDRADPTLGQRSRP